jgi:protein involved in polysaccharide export with SLBB domain
VTKPTPRKAALLAAALCLVFSACRSNLRQVPSVDQLDSHAIEVAADYVIGEGDILKVSVWRNPELSLDSVVVRPDGKISVALVDDVQAAGLTPLELKEVLTERLGEYVTALQVTVIVVQIRSKLVYVMGEVALPPVCGEGSDQDHPKHERRGSG